MKMKLYRAKGRLFLSNNANNVSLHVGMMMTPRGQQTIEELPEQSIVVIGSQTFTVSDLINHYQNKAAKSKAKIDEHTSILINDGRLN